MLIQFLKSCRIGLAIFGLLTLDYILGKGLVEMCHNAYCKVACFVRKTVREEEKNIQVKESPIKISMLMMELVVLGVTMGILNRYKQFRSRDRLDELLYESKEALKRTNEFIEKWKLRRTPTEYNYLDDEPQEIQPLRLEVPILHMAIVDTLGTTRTKLERGDAGDTINITDSALLSVTSLLEDDLDLETQPPSEEKLIQDPVNVEIRSRYLWDVIEEDSNTEY